VQTESVIRTVPSTVSTHD